MPLGADAAQHRGDENYNIMVRLKPGVSLQQAQADLNMIANRIRIKDKRDRTFGMHIVGLNQLRSLTLPAPFQGRMASED